MLNVIVHILLGEPNENDGNMPEQCSKVPFTCNKESDTTAQLWDACLLVDGTSPETIMAQTMRVADYATAEATQLTNMDELPQHLGLVGYIIENSVRYLWGMLHDTRAVNERHARVNPWCLDRNSDRGVARSGNPRALYRTQHPYHYRGVAEYVKETATGWNTPIAGRNAAPPHRLWNEFFPRALGCTCFQVLTEVVEHKMLALSNMHRASWDIASTGQPTWTRAKILLTL